MVPAPRQPLERGRKKAGGRTGFSMGVEREGGGVCCRGTSGLMVTRGRPDALWQAARGLQDSFKQTPVRMMGATTISMDGAPGTWNSKEEQDKRLEEEEAEIAFPREEMERIKHEDVAQVAIAERKKAEQKKTVMIFPALRFPFPFSLSLLLPSSQDC